MMKVYRYPPATTWKKLAQRPGAGDLFMEKLVRKILLNVKEKGDAAVAKYSSLFDKNQQTLETTITHELKEAIKLARKNIESFHRDQATERRITNTMPGVSCWQEARPIDKVGLYIPGGTAPLFSTILMLAVPARIAGCREIVLCCPSDHPAIRYTAKLCGIEKIYKIGGAQAIAAMAYGTKTIPKVSKIFGPGNQYVTLAKQLVQLEGVGIDMPAGPSELLVIADDSANPGFVAADLLAQAEHAENAQVMLVTDSRKLVTDVQRCIKEQLKELPRHAIAKTAFKNSAIILLNSLSDAVLFSNQYAPEHLVIATRNDLSKKISAAGSVFIGNYSAVSVGDYASGTNHVLPTNGYAVAYSGITLASFQTTVLFQKLSKQGLINISSAVMTMAEAEGLEAHKKAIQVRL